MNIFFFKFSDFCEYFNLSALVCLWFSVYRIFKTDFIWRFTLHVIFRKTGKCFMISGSVLGLIIISSNIILIIIIIMKRLLHIKLHISTAEPLP